MNIDTKKLERARVIRGWSKAKLAEIAEMDASTVGRVEAGKNLKPETVKQIADVLGLTMEELVIEDEVAS